MATTTQQLIDEIRLYSNLKNNQFFSDLEILRFANDAKDELFDILVATFEHYRTKTFDFTLNGSTASVDLPPDFYKDNLLELNPGTQQVQTIFMVENYLQRNQGAGPLDVYTGPGANRRYLIEDAHLTILPSAQASATQGVYRLYYTPLMQDFGLPYQVDLDATPDLVVAAMTFAPVAGSWTVLGDNHIQLDVVDPMAPPFSVDGYVPLIGEKVFFQKDDAPISEETMGVWLYNGLFEDGGPLSYDFRRPDPYVAGQTIQPGHKIVAEHGSINKGMLKKTANAWAPAVGTTELTDVNYTFQFSPGFNGFFFGNPQFTTETLESIERTTWAGGFITMTDSLGPNEAIPWPITSAPNPTTVYTGDPMGREMTPWPIAITARVLITFADAIYEVPLILLPWKLYIVVHASITIRTARQQDTSQLEAKLQGLKARVTKMAANRTEMVTQAPYMRKSRRGLWGGF